MNFLCGKERRSQTQGCQELILIIRDLLVDDDASANKSPAKKLGEVN